MRSPRCSYHTLTNATGTCLACGREICDVCTVRTGGVASVVCAPCARRAHQRQPVRYAIVAGTAVIALVLIVVGARLAYVAYRSTSAEATGVANDGPSPVAIPPSLVALDEAMRKEPCDRTKALRLVDGLMRADENRAALARGTAFFETCGDYPLLRAATLEAHKRLTEWDAALSDATLLIEGDRDNLNYWWWRGQIYQERSDWENAAHDYEQALALRPGATTVAFYLADVEERAGRPCDGISALEEYAYYNASAGDEARRKLAALYLNPACSGQAGSGQATIRARPGSTTFATRARVNGVAMSDFVVDTGASFVAISAPFARRLGLAYASWPTVRVITAAGIRSASRGFLEELKVQGVTARHVECVVSPELPADQNLLGLSFLTRFDVAIDPAKSSLKLSTHTKPPVATAPRGAASTAAVPSALPADVQSIDALPNVNPPAGRPSRRR